MTPQQQIDAILKDFLSVPDAAQAVGIGPRMVQTAAASGHIPGCVRTGRDLWIPQAWVAARLQAHGTGQIPQANRNYARRNSMAIKDLGHGKKSRKKSSK